MKRARYLLLFEVVFFLVPVSLVMLTFGIGVLGVLVFGGSSGTLASRLVAIFELVLSVSAVIAAWFIAVSFIAGGHERLRRIGGWVYGVVSIGAVMALVGGAAILADLFIDKGPKGNADPMWHVVLSSQRIFAFGLPALIPYFHLMYEWQARR